jgi:predicted Rossmann-fold nucleotide-binding protein
MKLLGARALTAVPDKASCDTTPPAFQRAAQFATTLKDPALRAALQKHVGDADLFVKSLSQSPSGASVYGTARSKPSPTDNGFIDYVFCEQLGEELRQVGLPARGGAGPGAMEAFPRGALRGLLVGLMDQGKPIPADPVQFFRNDLQGGNIILGANETSANAFTGRVSTFRGFPLRERWIYEGGRLQEVTPGGFGTMMELMTLLALKTRGVVREPIYLGAPDDYFERLAPKFQPFLLPSERSELERRFTSPRKLAQDSAKNIGPEEAPPAVVARRIITDLRIGIERLDNAPAAVSFFGGEGAITQAAAPQMAELAKALAEAGVAIRVGGSSIVDRAVMDGVRDVANVEVQGFGLREGLNAVDAIRYTRLSDLQSLTELLTLKTKGLVLAPESAAVLSVFFSTVCDLQTNQKPKFPIVVFDPEGKFADLVATMRSLMLSDSPKRAYINPEDTNLFKVTSDPKVAAQYILEANAPPAVAPAA